MKWWLDFPNPSTVFPINHNPSSKKKFPTNQDKSVVGFDLPHFPNSIQSTGVFFRGRPAFVAPQAPKSIRVAAGLLPPSRGGVPPGMVPWLFSAVI